MKTDSLPPVTLLHGDDNFAIAEHVTVLKARLGPPETAALNVNEFDARQASISEIRAVADTMPFLAPQRMVVVAGLENRSGGLADRPLVDDLIAYLPGLPAFTALALVVNANLPEKKRLVKAVRDHAGGNVQRFDVPRGAELARWVQQRAAAQGGEFAPDGAFALANAAGEEPRLLAQEIDKLLAYVDWSRPVRAADVERLTPAAGHASIFKLVDALGEKKGRVAMAELQRLLDQPGQEPFSIFAMIVRQFRLLLLAKELLQRGQRMNEIADALQVRPFVAQKVVEQTNRHSQQQLERIYARLVELDVEMKTGADQFVTLDILVAGLTV